MNHCRNGIHCQTHACICRCSVCIPERVDVKLAIDRMVISGAPGDGLTAWAAEEVLNEVRRLRTLLADARNLISTLNANIQGQTEANVRDPIAYAACLDMIARIDVRVPRTNKERE